MPTFCPCKHRSQQPSPLPYYSPMTPLLLMLALNPTPPDSPKYLLHSPIILGPALISATPITHPNALPCPSPTRVLAVVPRLTPILLLLPDLHPLCPWGLPRLCPGEPAAEQPPDRRLHRGTCARRCPALFRQLCPPWPRVLLLAATGDVPGRQGVRHSGAGRPSLIVSSGPGRCQALRPVGIQTHVDLRAVWAGSRCQPCSG